MRHALAETADASVRVILRDPEQVIVSVDEPHHLPATPQRLRSVPYLRPFAHLKHLGGFAQTLVEATTPSSRRPVPLGDTDTFAGAFLVNSIGVVAVASIDDVELPDAGRLLTAVVQRQAAVPWEPV